MEQKPHFRAGPFLAPKSRNSNFSLLGEAYFSNDFREEHSISTPFEYVVGAVDAQR
ncbi:MAG: hypothetical protein GY820_45045 [Gammaproteobacteria bacterium]|nr:hypothetical protein [Gammaproteobacteria bacterium]